MGFWDNVLANYAANQEQERRRRSGLSAAVARTGGQEVGGYPSWIEGEAEGSLGGVQSARLMPGGQVRWNRGGL